MLVSLKKFVGVTAIASLVSVLAPAQGAQAQAAQDQAQPAAGGAQKNWKDRAEFDLYDSAAKEATPAKRLEILNQWKEKYATTDFKLERELLYLDTYQKLGQAPKILESAKNIVAIDPQNLTALYWMSYLTTSLNDTSPGALDTGEKAATALLGALDTTFAPAKKPAGTTDEQWGKARSDMEALGNKTLGWVAMIRKDGAKAQEYLIKSLEKNPSAGEISYWLGQTIVAEKKPETYPKALYHFARASAYDGPGALPADGRKQVDDYLTKAYTGFHGDTSGLAELKTKAKTAPLPPADFAIASVRDIEMEKMKKEEEFNKSNPLVAKWKQYKQALVTDAATWEQMKGAKLDTLKGTVVSATSKTVVLALSDSTTPEVTLQFETPVKADPGASIEFAAVASEFTKEPFMLTMTAEKGDVQGLSAAPAAKKPAPSKSKRR